MERHRLIRTFLISILVICQIKNGTSLEDAAVSAAYGGAPSGLTEHPGGTLTEGQQRLVKAKSPYWLRSDIIVERNAELVIEPGVEVRFESMVGITVRGILTAVVSRFYSSNKPSYDFTGIL